MSRPASGWVSRCPAFLSPLAPGPDVFVALMVAIAVLCSWVGALCWNVASQKLPTVILGPLIVFETLAGLLYTFILRQEFPPLLTVSGIALLIVGVVIAVRARAAETRRRRGFTIIMCRMALR
ncbi:Inner membrane protein ytfF [Citrobacter koseri]|uniref:Inner membrane protein ytfF n=1 Tax=Citrobacter koseri TaxID=545 RepID=A0A2X2VB71_CITKO|nr:Inner membrane protein ytfF [Citrobacter koseri]